MSVANDKFVPGLHALVLSLLDVYPTLACDFIVFHDGSLSPFIQTRLTDLYPRLTFIIPDMEWFTQVPKKSSNQQRIGVLGYMNTEALRLQGYERIVILDSDMVILGDISDVWRGPDGQDMPLGYVEDRSIFACNDVGVTRFSGQSRASGQSVINSGMISIPARYLSSGISEQMRSICNEYAQKDVCSLLDRFADQKIWNLFVVGKDLLKLPVNFNCNVKFFYRFLQSDLSFVRILHFTGPKPWFSRKFLGDDVVFSANEEAVGRSVWETKYRTLLCQSRLRQYLTHRQGVKLSQIGRGSVDGLPACVFIGNGPSIASTDLTRFSDYEKFVFNWFVNHSDFDSLKPENLVLGSHMLFGGWVNQNPSLPKSFVDTLLSKKWRPKIWSSFYFKPYFDSLSWTADFELDYFLFEKPFKWFVDDIGFANLDLKSFCTDGRTGVLTAALPIAIAKGYKRFGLIGCDSNYTRTTNDYFYAKELHSSATTDRDSLAKIWSEQGAGQYCYSVAQDSLLRRGMSFVNFDPNGVLPVPRVPL